MWTHSQQRIKPVILAVLLSLANQAQAGAVVMPPVPPAQAVTSAIVAPTQAKPSIAISSSVIPEVKPAAITTPVPLAPALAISTPAIKLESAPTPLVEVVKPKIKRKAKIKIKHAPHSEQVVSPVADVVKKEDPYSAVTLNRVSDKDFNRFVFPSPTVRIDFPTGSPVVGQPIYLNGNREALIQFVPGSTRVTQMVATLSNGQVAMLFLKPGPAAGAVIRVDGAADSQIAKLPKSKVKQSADQGDTLSPSATAAKLLESISRGIVPAGYDTADLSTLVPIQFDKFIAIPVMAYSNQGDRKISIYQLNARSGETVVLAPPQFYREGVLSVLLDRDTLTDSAPANLYVVEEVLDGAR